MKYMNNSTTNTSSVRFHSKPFVTNIYGRENTQWTPHGENVAYYMPNKRIQSTYGFIKKTKTQKKTSATRHTIY